MVRSKAGIDDITHVADYMETQARSVAETTTQVKSTSSNHGNNTAERLLQAEKKNRLD
jgi:hypothetical protein